VHATAIPLLPDPGASRRGEVFEQARHRTGEVGGISSIVAARRGRDERQSLARTIADDRFNPGLKTCR